MASNNQSEIHLNSSKELLEIIRNRRSIRQFTDKDIPDAVLKQILAAGIRAPFAGQLYSIVHTRNHEKMRELKSIGVYKTTKILMIFFIDLRKIEKIIKQRGYTYDFDDGMALWLAIQDVSLAVDHVILAAEAYGLGSVLLGAAPLKADLISGIFGVPSRVFPVVGLCLGYPDPCVETDVRPRFPLKFAAFEDGYQDLSEADIKTCMQAMDEGYRTQGYYMKLVPKVPLQKGKDTIDLDRYSWSEHISRKFSQGLRGSKEPLLSALRRHGFNLE